MDVYSNLLEMVTASSKRTGRTKLGQSVRFLRFWGTQKGYFWRHAAWGEGSRCGRVSVGARAAADRDGEAPGLASGSLHPELAGGCGVRLRRGDGPGGRQRGGLSSLRAWGYRGLCSLCDQAAQRCAPFISRVILV